MQESNNLFIFYYFPPHGMSGSIRACKIAKYLKEKMDFFVISSKTKHWVYDKSLLEDVENLNIIRIFDPIGFLIGGKIKEKNGKKFFIDSKFLWRYLAEIYIKKRFKNVKLIYVSSPPPSSIILGYKLKKFFNSKLLIELRDEWLSKNERRGKEILEILKNADGIVYSYEGLMEKFKIKGIVAEHGYEERVKSEKNKEKFKIFYTGTLKDAQDSFIKLVREIKNLKDVEIHYAGIMPENLPEDIKNFINYHGFVSYKNLKNLLKYANLFLLVFDKIGDYTAPSRFFEYCAYDIPILCIAPKGIYLERVLKERNKGFYFSKEEIEKAIKIIEELKTKEINIEFSGNTWKECAEKIYEYIKGI
ncbi:MAG: glycosyltransferase [candidate division WOR-3 bacterium]